MTSIDLSRAPRAVGRGAPDPVPALLVERVAVDRQYAGLGVGTALVAHALATAVDINAQVACRAVVVVALHHRARTWWERFGFHPFVPEDPGCLELFLLTDEIGATLRHLAEHDEA